jgi:hypothetical protein
MLALMRPVTSKSNRWSASLMVANKSWFRRSRGKAVGDLAHSSQVLSHGDFHDVRLFVARPCHMTECDLPEEDSAAT